jgi:O-antigen ligase
MTTPPTSDPFRLPRLSRARTLSQGEPHRWSDLLAQLAFLVLVVLALGGPWMTDQGDAALGRIREIGYAAVLLATLVAVRPWRHPERLLVVPWPLLVALGWCYLSLSWAFYPAVGLRRLILTTIILWSLFAQLREIGLERAIVILRGALAVLLAVNFYVVIWLPVVGVGGAGEADLAGDWRGMMSQKNWAGFTCAMTLLLFAFDAGRVPVAIRAGVGIAAAFFLVKSDSATSMGVGAAALLFGCLLVWQARRAGQRPIAPPGWAWVPFGLFAAVCVSIALNPKVYLQMVSDPAGFTGRYQIWTALIHAYADRPLFGVGYGSLWDLGPEGPIATYAQGWVATVSQGHNGYLDLLVQVGAPGMLLVLFATLVWPLQRLLRGGDSPVRVLAGAMLLFCLGHNFTESTLFDRDALGQVFLMIAIAMLWTATAASIHAPAGSDGERRTRQRRTSTSSRGSSRRASTRTPVG